MTLESYVQGFGCVPNPTSYEDAKAVVLPIPLDWGVGEVPGVALGPMAILGASRFIETFDSELGLDPLDDGVATLDALDLDYSNEESPLDQICAELTRILGDGKLALCLGGERSIALPATRAAKDVYGDVGVVALIRRPGLLDLEAGRRYVPATIGRRLLEEAPVRFIGPRYWSRDEDAAVRPLLRETVLTARMIEDEGSPPAALLTSLPERIHLSLDVGVLDPAALAVSGNIEPGGVSWFRLAETIDKIFEEREVVSIDISGFAPVLGHITPSLVVAQLGLRCLGRAMARRAAKESRR